MESSPSRSTTTRNTSLLLTPLTLPFPFLREIPPARPDRETRFLRFPEITPDAWSPLVLREFVERPKGRETERARTTGDATGQINKEAQAEKGAENC